MLRFCRRFAVIAACWGGLACEGSSGHVATLQGEPHGVGGNGANGNSVEASAGARAVNGTGVGGSTTQTPDLLLPDETVGAPPLGDGECTPDLVGPIPDGIGEIEMHCWAWCALASLTETPSLTSDVPDCDFDPQLTLADLTMDAEIGSADAPQCPDSAHLVMYLEGTRREPYCGPMWELDSDAGISDQCCYLIRVTHGI